MTIIEFIYFVQEKKILIRRISGLLTLILLCFEIYISGAVYEAYSPGIWDVAAMVKEIKTTEIIRPFLFLSFWMFYATITKHMWVHIAILLFYFIVPNSGGFAFLLLLVFFELFYRYVYLAISNEAYRTKDISNKVIWTTFKYTFKTLGISLLLLSVYALITSLFYSYVRDCGTLPFKEFFSKYGYRSCDEIIDLTLVHGSYRDSFFWGPELIVDEDSKRIKFQVPRSYVNDNDWRDGEVDKFTLHVAYPTYEPWYKAKARFVERAGDEPIEIKIELTRSKNEKSKPSSYTTFVPAKYGLKKDKEFYHYYPVDEEVPIDYITCGGFEFSPNASCTATVIFSDYLRGKYTFKHKDLPNWQEIDLEVRKLIASLMVPKQQERVYLVDQ